MAGKLGKFQMTGFSYWKGLTSENHLGAIYQLAPQKASSLMVQLQICQAKVVFVRVNYRSLKCLISVNLQNVMDKKFLLQISHKK